MRISLLHHLPLQIEIECEKVVDEDQLHTMFEKQNLSLVLISKTGQTCFSTSTSLWRYESSTLSMPNAKARK